MAQSFQDLLDLFTYGENAAGLGSSQNCAAGFILCMLFNISEISRIPSF